MGASVCLSVCLSGQSLFCDAQCGHQSAIESFKLVRVVVLSPVLWDVIPRTVGRQVRDVRVNVHIHRNALRCRVLRRRLLRSWPAVAWGRVFSHLWRHYGIRMIHCRVFHRPLTEVWLMSLPDASVRRSYGFGVVALRVSRCAVSCPH